jgi:RNA polymerase sigma factor (sigma-70 family)
MSKYPDDDQILKSLANGKESSWRKLYDDLRSPFRLYFIGNGCTPEEAIELFQEAMVILHRKVISKQLQPPMQSTIKTYLIGVGRILMMRRGKQKPGMDHEFPELGIDAEVDNQHEQVAKARLVQSLLSQLDVPCRKILELFYLKNYVMEAIAEELALPSAGAVRRRKHDCLKRLRALMH